jgi:hypothetical protein
MPGVRRMPRDNPTAQTPAPGAAGALSGAATQHERYLLARRVLMGVTRDLGEYREGDR